MVCPKICFFSSGIFFCKFISIVLSCGVDKIVLRINPSTPVPTDEDSPTSASSEQRVRFMFPKFSWLDLRVLQAVFGVSSPVRRFATQMADSGHRHLLVYIELPRCCFYKLLGFNKFVSLRRRP